MEDEERKLFHELIVASRVLVTVSRNAAVVLSEEFESMITGPADNVDSILKRCPEADAAWDGVFRLEDVEEDLFTPDIPGTEGQRVNSGVKLTHRHTGMSVEVYQSSDVQTNRERAQNALRTRVEDRKRRT
jgi:hypothetical protein